LICIRGALEYVAAVPVLSLSDVHTFYQGFLTARIPESHVQKLRGDDLVDYIGWCLTLHPSTSILTLSLYKDQIIQSPSPGVVLTPEPP
jgi:hypothetical protein